METGITFTFAAIFLGAAVLSSIALYAKQPIIIAYIALGVALGPYGLGVVSDMELVSGAGHVGIILLLVSARPRHEARCAMEQFASVHAGGTHQRRGVCLDRVRTEPCLWLQWLGCHSHQRRAGVFINDYRH